jgi:predicted P-loop ATPase
VSGPAQKKGPDDQPPPSPSENDGPASPSDSSLENRCLGSNGFGRDCDADLAAEAPEPLRDGSLKERLEAARDAYAEKCGADKVLANTRIAEMVLELRPDFKGVAIIKNICLDEELAELLIEKLNGSAPPPTSAFGAIDAFIEGVDLTSGDATRVSEVKEDFAQRLLGAWDSMTQEDRKLLVKALHRKLPGKIKDKPSVSTLMEELLRRRQALVPRSRVRLQSLMLNDKDQPLSNTYNACVATPQLLPGALHFNEFSQEAMVCWPGESERAWKDTDTTRLQVQLQKLGMVSMQPSSVDSAVNLIAHEHAANPIVEYLHGLQWDGTRRLSIWLREVFGTPTNSYHRRAGRNMFIALVARAMQPGCQVDEMLVLEGEQGTLKSSVWRTIGGKYFKELVANSHSKDFEQQLLGVWLGEFAELHTLRRAEGARIKQFITNLIDHFRLPWGRRFIDLPRRIVFCGTTNEETDWINDPTGGRRFIPVKVCQAPNLEWLREHRDQLFAEAVCLYKANRKWHVYPLKAVRAEQEMRITEDPWADSIAEYLCGRREVTVSEIIGCVLRIPLRDRNEGMLRKVGRSLSRLKCTAVPPHRVPGKPKPIRSWLVPEELAKQKIKVSSRDIEETFNQVEIVPASPAVPTTPEKPKKPVALKSAEPTTPDPLLALRAALAKAGPERGREILAKYGAIDAIKPEDHEAVIAACAAGPIPAGPGPSEGHTGNGAAKHTERDEQIRAFRDLGLSKKDATALVDDSDFPTAQAIEDRWAEFAELVGPEEAAKMQERLKRTKARQEIKL